jgi:hypothetical protein
MDYETVVREKKNVIIEVMADVFGIPRHEVPWNEFLESFQLPERRDPYVGLVLGFCLFVRDRYPGPRKTYPSL